jgi:predicted AAA+ superfamily ATPase
LPYSTRTQEQVLTDALDTTLIKIGVGPRRAGKSRLIQHALQRRLLEYLNFEEEQFIGVSTAVYLELRRWGLKNDFSLFHYRPAGEQEIDFVVKDSHETTELFQVCLVMTSMEAKAREVRALSIASTMYPYAQLTIVTANEAGSLETSAGKMIKIVPAYDFYR